MNDRTKTHWLMLSAVLAMLCPVNSLRAAEQPTYNWDVRPILSEYCFACHGPDANHREADLRLDQSESAFDRHADRAAIVPGKPSESELIARITSADPDLQMPPPSSGKKLTADQIATLRSWIASGADYQPHWAYVPPHKPEVPSGSHPIDALLARTFHREQITPVAAADRITLIRRVSFDLLGLPPSLEDVNRFENDTDPLAWEHVVDRLLSSPHFGERMAMYWFDLVRFADTVGYHGDQEHAVIPYRDYVIQAFNQNKRFDVFTREQLAGDLIPNASDEQKVASCYNRLLQTSHEGGVQVKEYLTKYESDRVRNLGGAWLGATLACAECHDHKYDPFTQRDFYRFAAIFADVDDLRSFKGGDTTPTKRDPEIVVPSPIEKETLPNPPTYRCMVTEAIEPRTIRIRPRGDWLDESGSIVEPGVPDWLSPMPVEGHRFNRLELSEWLTSGKNPLTARVFVNRLWALFFGSGLSRSLDDFGAQGEAPSDPELLDWLACEFVDSGWDMKHMVRLIVTSEAYRRSSRTTPELAANDPENRWFARQSAFRLPAEMIRDNALDVSGLLARQIGGAKSHPYQPDGYYQFLNFPKRDYAADTDDLQYRRGVYIHWQRQYLHPMLRAFDAPMREECTAKRPLSNTPVAALTLLNDPTFLEAARALAVEVLQQPGSTTERIDWLWQRTLSRHPDAEELHEIEDLWNVCREEFAANMPATTELLSIGMSRAPAELDPVELAAWTTVCRVILNLHETITRG